MLERQHCIPIYGMLDHVDHKSHLADHVVFSGAPTFGVSLGLVYVSLGLFVLFAGIITLHILRSRVNHRHGNTLLLMAIRRNNFEVFRHFLPDCRANQVNAKDEKGSAPLLEAVKFGRAKFVNLLFEKGAQIDTQNNAGNTILHQAAQAVLRNDGWGMDFLSSLMGMIKTKITETDLGVLKAIENKENKTAWDLFQGDYKNKDDATYREAQALLQPEVPLERKQELSIRG